MSCIQPIRIPPSQKPFAQTRAGQERAHLRRAIQKSGQLSNNRKAILLYLLNLWFHHRNCTAEIHPGAEAIATKAFVSERTARQALAEFREAGFIVPIAYASGGRMRTRYRVEPQQILDVLAPSGVEVVPGELVPIEAYEKAGVLDDVPPDAMEQKPCKICRRLDDTSKTTLAMVADCDDGGLILPWLDEWQAPGSDPSQHLGDWRDEIPDLGEGLSFQMAC